MDDTDDKTQETLERKFIDYFGMTVEQFDKLDFDTQEYLIKQVAKRRRKEDNNIKCKILSIFKKK